MRDIIAQPYSPDEARVAKFFVDHCNIGGGGDPIGFIMCSHAALAEDRKQLRALLQEVLDHLRHQCTCHPASGCTGAVLRERIAGMLPLDHGLVLREPDPAAVKAVIPKE